MCRLSQGGGSDVMLILSLHCLFLQTFLGFILHFALLSSSLIILFGDEMTQSSTDLVLVRNSFSVSFFFLLVIRCGGRFIIVTL